VGRVFCIPNKKKKEEKEWERWMEALLDGLLSDEGNVSV